MESSLAIPPRYWWLKRLAIASGVLMVSLVGLRLAWGHIAHSRLQREIDRCRSSGEPVTIEEFNAQLAAVPDDDNAALLYEKALDVLVITATDGSNFDTFLYDDDSLAPFITRPAAAEELFTKNAPVYDLLRKARDRTQVAWSGGLDPNLMTPNSMMQRQLARSLAFAAARQFQSGNHEQAIETLIDFHRFNQAIAAHPNVISSLIAWACESMAFNQITQHAGMLSFSSDRAASSNHCPASRALIDRLITLYLDETDSRQLAARGRRGGAAALMHRFASSGAALGAFGIAAPPRSVQTISNLLDAVSMPGLTTDALAYFRKEYRMADVLTESDWSHAAPQFREVNPEPNLIDVIAFPMTRSPCCGPADMNHTGVRVFFQHLATRRMAAMALAIRLYEVDHGQRPYSLSVLVPEYLPALPIDPFSAPGASFQYAYEFPYDQARAYLYTIGANGLDNGGVLQDPLAKRTRSADDVPLYLDPEQLFMPPVPMPPSK